MAPLVIKNKLTCREYVVLFCNHNNELVAVSTVYCHLCDTVKITNLRWAHCHFCDKKELCCGCLHCHFCDKNNELSCGEYIIATVVTIIKNLDVRVLYIATVVIKIKNLVAGEYIAIILTIRKNLLAENKMSPLWLYSTKFRFTV